MHVRVTTLEVPPDRMDDAARHVQERVLPQLSQMEGFKGFVALGSRQSGKLQGVAFWESEEALRATDEAVVSVRRGAGGGLRRNGGERGGVRGLCQRGASAGPLGGVTGTVGGVTDTWRGHATGKRSDGHGERGHRQPPGRRREEKLAKGWQQVLTQGEARAGTDNTPALLHVPIHRSAWKVN